MATIRRLLTAERTHQAAVFFDSREVEMYALGPAEQELHVLWAQLLHSDCIVVDCPVDHVRLLLLQEDHTRLDRVFNTESRDDTRAFLTDTVAAIGGLPFCGRVPPSMWTLAWFAQKRRMSRSSARSGLRRIDVRINNEDP